MQGHRARKRFGQNFLVDQGIIHAIISAIDPRPDDALVEIGPGLGALTEPLLRRLAHLHVVEIDNDIVARLQKRPDAARLTIHHTDALKFDFGAVAPRLRVAGNLPYNISTPLLFHLSAFSRQVVDMHFMLQKEVVDRMAAAPSTSDYGRLSVMLQVRFAVEPLFEVPPEAFDPAPKVDSAIVRLTPLNEAAPQVSDLATLEAVVTAAFAQRRKTLRNTLGGLLSAAEFEQLGIDSSLRAENLTVEDFVRIANFKS